MCNQQSSARRMQCGTSKRSSSAINQSFDHHLHFAAITGFGESWIRSGKLQQDPCTSTTHTQSHGCSPAGALVTTCQPCPSFLSRLYLFPTTFASRRNRVRRGIEALVVLIRVSARQTNLRHARTICRKSTCTGLAETTNSTQRPWKPSRHLRYPRHRSREIAYAQPNTRDTIPTTLDIINLSPPKHNTGLHSTTCPQKMQ